MSEVHVSTWSDLYDALFEGSYNARVERYKSRYAFRGVSSSGYRLETSLMRLRGDYDRVEHHLLRQFKKYGYSEMKGEHSEWYWISVAQHYGLPTRLLDWSYSPEVALHFATANIDRFDRDGAVWKVNYKEAHKYLPDKLRELLDREETSLLTVDMLEGAYGKFRDLDGASGSPGGFVAFFEPPSLDARIFNQFAYFSICSNPRMLLDDWLVLHPDIWQKIVIPAKLKWEVRDKLDQNNVCERVLFPGLGGIASWLERYYRPTGSAATSRAGSP